MKFEGLKVATTEQLATRSTGVLEELKRFYPQQLELHILGGWARSSSLARETWKSSAEHYLGDLGAPAGDLDGEVFTTFGATYTLVEHLVAARLAGSKGIYFNPSGGESAQHGAEVLNDLGWAALRLADLGFKVAYLDWDAHPADAVEVLLEGHQDITTVSLNEFTPGGATSYEAGKIRLALGSTAGDMDFVELMTRATEHLADLELDVLVMNLGADALAGDPTSSLALSVPGMALAAKLLGELLADKDASVLLGGGAGAEEAPILWATTIAMMSSEIMIDQMEGVVR